MNYIFSVSEIADPLTSLCANSQLLTVCFQHEDMRAIVKITQGVETKFLPWTFRQVYGHVVTTRRLILDKGLSLL